MTAIPPLLHQILAGRYVLKREIGRGGAATVFLAHDVRHERLVAIKVLHPELAHQLGAQRFLREIKVTASLQHPHILPIHDSGEAGEDLYYVMPYVEGESLRQRLGAGNRLSVEESVRIGREVAGALAYAHEHGVVHRDIKPENILFSGGHAVLADFGIARSINGASEKITHQGTITGTPAYMSPEQARDRAFDGRSDVYSLACVLYEAIAGVPPFVGDSPQELLAQRIARVPPLLREYRHDVAPAIETVIARALSTAPDDRYDDARAFSAALSAAVGSSGATVVRTSRRALSRSPWLLAAGVALAVAGLAATTPGGRDRLDLLAGRVDTAQYAVLPFQYVGVAVPLSDAEPASGAAYDAMRRWDGLALASEMSVSDALHRRGMAPLTIEDVARIARSVRAGRAIWGRVRVTGDSLVVRAAVYDALTGESLREVTRAVPAGGVQALKQLDFRSIIVELLRPSRAVQLSSGADRGTASYAAWQAFERGGVALAHWDMDAATAALERSVAADPAYPQAHLWLAQLRFLQGRETGEWESNLRTAQRGHPLFNARDQGYIDALTRLAHGDSPSACRAFAALGTRDSLDAMAWLSVALCQMQDSAIVRSGRGATSAAFRVSPEAILVAATRALELAPESFALLPYARLRNQFPVDHNVLRLGRLGQTVYAAWPELDGDTVAYRPVSQSRVATLPTPPQYEAALRYNRGRLLGLLQVLTRRLPDNADAFEALTTLLEARDEISGTPNGRYSALTALERARTLAVAPGQRLRLAVMDLRLHLKLGDFARSAAIADSLLQANPEPSPAEAKLLSGVAAFAGHAGLAARYDIIPRTAGGSADALELPAAADAVSALVMRAALGMCDDSLRTLTRSVDRTLASYVDPAHRAAVREHVLERALMLEAPCNGGRSSLELHNPGAVITTLAQLIARGESTAARHVMDSIAVARRGSQPGSMSLDVLVLHAWARGAVGDPRGAAEQLDLVLSALPTLSLHITTDPVLAASVGRSMALRADLARRLNDPATAAMWAGRVLTVWGRADTSLEPVLARMRLLAGR